MSIAELSDWTDIKKAVDAGFSVTIAPGTYSFNDSQSLVLKSGQTLAGAGPERTILEFTGSNWAITTTDVATVGVAKNIRIAGLSIQGTSSGAGGILLNGAWFSSFEDLDIRNFPNGVGIHGKAKKDFALYYNVFRSVKCGGTARIIAGVVTIVNPNQHGWKFETTDFATEGRRANSNVLVMSSAQWNTVSGMTASACQALQLVGCNFEQNRSSPTGGSGKGAVFTDCANVFVEGGYFEGHPNGDIELGSNTFYTMLLRAHLASAIRLTGASVGATGDVYLLAESSTAPGPTVYDGNWMQKVAVQRAHIESLNAGYLEFAKSTVTRVGYAKVDADAFYRFQLYNDGVMEWGSGAAAVDTKLSRGGANLLSVGAGDDLKVDGAWNSGRLRLGGWYVWVDATSQKLRFKNGSPPTSEIDGAIIGP